MHQELRLHRDEAASVSRTNWGLNPSKEAEANKWAIKSGWPELLRLVVQKRIA